MGVGGVLAAPSASCSVLPRGGGGRPGPVLVCNPPPPGVLRDSGAGAMVPTAPNFFLHA